MKITIATLKGFMYNPLRKLKPILSICLVFFYIVSNAQFYESGQDPASLKWEQINTPNFQVIFPENFSTQATRLANILEYIYKYAGKTLNEQPKKITVILHSHSLYSNGFVVWSPKRMELFPMPSQEIYPQEWLEQLAIHELRHAVQIEKLNQGITKIASLLLGEQLNGAMAGLMPRWFMEGDAVALETGLTNAGRGRMPSFESALRAQTLERDKIFPYDKAKMGSFKNFIPDYYELGYQMTAYARIKYSYGIWDSILNFIGRNPFTINPFYFGLKKYGNTSNDKLYIETFYYLDSLWRAQDKKTQKTPFITINRQNPKDYTSYKNPIPINDTLTFAVKSGLGQIKEFILIDKKGQEKKLISPGPLSSEKVTCDKNILIWSEFIPDIRWEHKNYSVIKTLDINSNKEKVLTRKTRYFSPSISPEGTKIAVVEVSVKNEYSLTLLDAFNGEKIDRFQVPLNQFIQHPAWDEKGNIITIGLGKGGKSILKLNTATGAWETILAPTFTNLRQSIPSGGYIFYESSYSGIDNIYAMDTLSKKTFQVTSSRFGAFNVFANDKALYYSDYSSHGFDIVKAFLHKENWIETSLVTNQSARLFEPLSKQEGKIINSDEIPEKTYPVKPYKKWQHLFNFHSWSPFYFDYNNLGYNSSIVFPGASLLSQNKLGTAFTTLGYAYYRGYHYFHSRFTYKEWLPELEFAYDYGGQAYFFKDTAADSLPENLINQSAFSSTLSIPLNFSRGRFIRGIKPSVKFSFKNSYLYNSVSDSYKNSVPFIEYNLLAYNYQILSNRDIVPKWGEQAMFKYIYSPINKEYFGSMYAFEANLYFPGAFKHHAVKIKLGYQEQDPKKFMYTGFLNPPRGYEKQKTEKLFNTSMSYIFPIIYPDLKIGHVAYFKRIRGELFLDYAYNEYTNPNDGSLASEHLKSLGMEILTDYHLFRIMFPVSSGLKYIYLANRNNHILGFIFNINFSIF